MAKKAAPADAASATDLVTPDQAAPVELGLTYEQALAELDQLVSDMEAGNLPLDRLLSTYQRGATLLSFCRSRLEAVEAQVKVLEDGQLQPWSEP
ncbi:MAG: hypothetical protein RI907_819 [Pseudomonadota bacterium]|jgi:exodeoxyribonuclease VII small subunit